MEVAQASIDNIFTVSRKITLTRATFLTYLLPYVVSVYFMAGLVQLKGTRTLRLALLPIFAWLTRRAMSIDMSGGDLRQAQANAVFIVHMSLLSTRVTLWALAREPYHRRISDESGKSEPENVYTAFWNAWDLMFGLRGIGWNWPRGLIVPKPTFETDSRFVFVFMSLGRLVFYSLALDAYTQAARMLSPNGFGSINGGSLFDHTLPFHLELLRAISTCFLALWMSYFLLEWSYQLLAIVSVILFWQHPSQWPPLFDSPWLSTSLSELWGRRWHQLLRQLLVAFGAFPFSSLFGRPGGLIGAFLISGIIHDIELRAIGRGGNSVIVIGFWVMNGVGVVLERIWKKATGRQVGGTWGWIWTFGWLTLWGIWMVDEWAKTGRFGMACLPGEIEPLVMLVRFVRRCLAA